jgi:single-strand DNA-binding protein
MLNRASIIGHLCQTPKFKETTTGTKVVSFGVATNSKWKDKATGEVKEETEFHNVVIFGRLAEVCVEFLKQGSKVFMAGSLKTQSWEDKDSGKNMYRTEIVVREMEMLDNKPKDENAQRNQGTQQQAGPAGNQATQQAPAQGAAPNLDDGPPAYDSEVKPEDLPF